MKSRIIGTPTARFSALLLAVLLGPVACSTAIPRYCAPYEDDLTSISKGFEGPALAAHLRVAGYSMFTSTDQSSDRVLAMCLYEKASSLGDAEAAYLLAPLYFTGVRGVGEDRSKASEMLRISAGRGHCIAQLDLARELRAQGSDAEADVWRDRARAGGCVDAEGSAVK